MNKVMTRLKCGPTNSRPACQLQWHMSCRRQTEDLSVTSEPSAAKSDKAYLERFVPECIYERNTKRCVIASYVSYFFKKIAPTCSSTRFGTPCQQLTYISSFALLPSPFAGLFFIEALRHACVICVISLCRKGLQRKIEKMRGGSPILFQSAIQNRSIRVIRTIRVIWLFT
jgi:hypothetical protein